MKWKLKAAKDVWGFPKVGGIHVGTHNKVYYILGSILRSPYVGKLYSRQVTEKQLAMPR